MIFLLFLLNNAVLHFTHQLLSLIRLKINSSWSQCAFLQLFTHNTKLHFSRPSVQIHISNRSQMSKYFCLCGCVCVCPCVHVGTSNSGMKNHFKSRVMFFYTKKRRFSCCVCLFLYSWRVSDCTISIMILDFQNERLF